MDPQNNLIEPTNKSHRIIFIVITILLTAGVVGGSLWYAMNQITKEQNNKITELEKKLSEKEKKVEIKKEEVKTETKKDTITPVEIKKEPDIRNADLKKAAQDEVIAQNIYTKSSILDGSAMIISEPKYGDLTGDGNEEAVVAAIDSGSGACNRTFVYNYKNAVLNKLAYFDVPSGSKCHNSIKIVGTELVESYSLYNEGDGNCCPSGGTKKDYYKWNGTIFNKYKEEKI